MFVGTIKRRKIMETMFRIEIEEKGILKRKEEKEREREIDSLKVFQEARTIEISN